MYVLTWLRLARAALGSPAERASQRVCVCGGGILPFPPFNLRTVGRSKMGEVAIENSQRVFFLILTQVTSQVRSNVKIVTFRLIGYRDRTNNNSCEPKLSQKTYQGIKKVVYKYGPYTK